MSSKKSSTFVGSTVATAKFQPSVETSNSNFDQTNREMNFSNNGQPSKKELKRYSNEDLLFFEANLLSILGQKKFIFDSNQERINELGKVSNKDENITLINVLTNSQKALSRHIEKIEFALNRIKNKNYGQKPGGGLFTKEELIQKPLRIK